MTVYFMDGMSDRGAGTFPQFGWKYASTNLGGVFIDGYPFRNAPLGLAWAQTDQGSSAIEKAITIQTMSHWVSGRRIKVTLNGLTSSVFATFQSSQTGFTDQDLPNGTTLFTAYYATDGTVSFYTGGTGIESDLGTLLYLGTPGQKLISGQWTYFEFDIQFGASGSLTVMQDDALFCSVSGVSIGPTFPDRMVAIRKARGNLYGEAQLAIADVYIADTLLGPCKVTSWPMGANAIPEGFTEGGSVVNPKNFQQINDYPGTIFDSPDGDRTFVQNDSGAVTDLYKSGRVACYGKILAVAQNVTCRAIAGTPTMQMLVRQRATRYDLGLPVPVPLGSYVASRNAGIIPPGTDAALYAMIQRVSSSQPSTGEDWIDQAISNTDWGMSSDALGTFRVTAVTLEKLVSQRNAPYDCAGGSYSF